MKYLANFARHLGNKDKKARKKRKIGLGVAVGTSALLGAGATLATKRIKNPALKHLSTELSLTGVAGGTGGYLGYQVFKDKKASKPEKQRRRNYMKTTVPVIIGATLAGSTVPYLLKR
jgi:uncharacterized membrane protein YebE (DUF533 family)